jgi:hypothetical protein
MGSSQASNLPKPHKISTFLQKSRKREAAPQHGTEREIVTEHMQNPRSLCRSLE